MITTNERPEGVDQSAQNPSDAQHIPSPAEVQAAVGRIRAMSPLASGQGNMQMAADDMLEARALELANMSNALAYIVDAIRLKEAQDGTPVPQYVQQMLVRLAY